jgi:hypothetical protein
MFKNRLEFKGAVIGMCLGDGHLRIPKGGKEAQYSMTHCLKQKNYMFYKIKMLEYLTTCWNKEGSSFSDGKMHLNWKMQTQSHPFYTKLMDHLYFDKRRTVNEHVMKCITPLGLALWYQDDGTLRQNDDFLIPVIFTYAYSKTEVEMMCRMLQKKFGLQWRCNRHGNYYAMRLRRSDRKTFYDLIRPYVHPSNVTLNCSYCGNDFDVEYKNRKIRKYCSSKCYHDSRLKNKEESHAKKACKI